MCNLENMFQWRYYPHSIINLIPKYRYTCLFTPLNYSGIIHLCILSKVYSGILFIRINSYCDIRNILVDEQNCFRQNRSCIDHIFYITIVKNYICVYKCVFCSFIDFKKAFDAINRNRLIYRLLSYNIYGKIFKAIKSLNKDTVSTVKIIIISLNILMYYMVLNWVIVFLLLSLMYLLIT